MLASFSCGAYTRKLISFEVFADGMSVEFNREIGELRHELTKPMLPPQR